MAEVPHYDWVAYHAAGQPDALAQHDLHSGRRFTYAEMEARVSQLAAFLQQQASVAVGDRIASICHNTTDVFEMAFAAQRIGAIYIPINWRLAIPELEFILQDCEPKVLFFSREFEPRIEELRRLVKIPTLLAMEDGEASDYEAALAGASGSATPKLQTLEQTWMLMYTSGTTGRPKGAQHTYRAHVFNAINCQVAVDLSKRSNNLCVLPLFHVGGMNAYGMPCFHFGAANTVMRQFDPALCLSLLANPDSGVTHTFAVPTNMQMMAALPEFESARFEHLVGIGIGGSAVPVPLLQLYASKGLAIQQGWGMTELTSIGTQLQRARALDKIGSCGRPVMHAELRIADAEGRTLGAGEVGELQVKGPIVIPGYWRRPEANETSFIDGWFKTGDAAVRDEEGYYKIVDRWKDMYISGGENVYPAEIENALYRLDGIAECAVIGIADAKWGEVGRAYIVRKPGSTLGEDDVIAHCQKNLARYKVPKSVRFLAELPHNATGKITKHALPRD